MRTLAKICETLDAILRWLAGFFLAAMVVLTTSDIVLRWFGCPINGSVELMGFMGAMAASLALGYTQKKRMHIAVTIVVDSYTKPVRKVIKIINNTISIVFFVLASWQLLEWAETLRSTGELTETLRMIYYPFAYGVALGCLFLSFVYLMEILNELFQTPEIAQ